MAIKKYKSNQSGFKSRSASGLAALIMTVSSGLAVADDTEVFFGRNSAQPNVLLILDVSGSMDEKDGTTQTRLDRLKIALNELLTTTNDINVGLMSYSGHGTNFLHAIKPVTDNRDELIASINALDASGGTPTVTALHEGKLYFTGEALNSTRKRSFKAPFNYTCTDPDNVTTACWDQPYGAQQARDMRLPDTDSYVLGPESAAPYMAAGSLIRHAHCTDANPNHPSCTNEEIVGVAHYNTPMASECQSNHIVLLTDGKPTDNTLTQARANQIAQDIGITSCQLEPGYPEGGRCAAELSAYMTNNDLNLDLNQTNNVITHTIGFELAGASSQWLQGLSETSGGGTHHNAGSAASLVEAFENIVEVAQKELNTFVAPAITVDRFSGLSHREDVYLALFKPSSRSNWQGNLKRYDYVGSPPVLRDFHNQVAVDADGKFVPGAVSWWSDTLPQADGNTVSLGGAAYMLDADNRSVYTNISGTVLKGVDENQVHENNTAITSAILGVPAAERVDLLKWARGVDVLDYDEDPSTTTRKEMGDPLHSKPVLVTYGKVDNKPDSVAFFGTNQGYLHAINTQDGKEVFSFVPKELLPNMDTFYKDERRVTKLYGLDGDITTWIKDDNNDGIINNDDHAYLYIGMRRGGNNYYALNVTDKNDPKVLWTKKGGPAGDSGFAELGQSWSKPTLGKMIVGGAKTDVLIFGGGYDPMQDNTNIRSDDTVGNALFIINATNGDLVWKADVNDFDEMTYSIPSDPTVIDVNGDGLTDQIYVGDMGGQVWRFDINKDVTGDLVKGGVIASLANDSADGFRKFFYRPDIALIKASPSYLSVSIGSGNRAHPLDEVVDNRFYMIKQYSVVDAPEEYGMEDPATGNYRPVTESDLYDATDNDVQNTDLIVADNARQALNESEGWLVRLTESGEKVLSQSLTINSGVNFTTYLPDANNAEDICSPSIGRSRLYRMLVNDATPVDGTTRHSDAPGSGIASSTNLFFTKDGDAYIQEGTRTVDSSNLDKLRKTFWSEQTD